MTVTKPQNATLIDSIGDGYRAINRRPWLLLVPILLNLYLWFGTPLSVGPLITNAVATMRALQPSSEQGDLQTVYDQILSRGGTDVRDQMAFLNAIPTLSLRVIGPMSQDGGLSVPSAPQVLIPTDSRAIQISTIGGALLAFLAINALALALSAIFLAQLGAAVQQERPGVAGPRRAVRIGLSLLASALVLIGVALVLGLPLLFFAFLLLLINQTLGLLALELIFAVGFWIGIYVGFYPEAIVISGLGPLRAIHASFNVVRRNFWSTLGFLALTLGISWGLDLIWTRMVNTTAGLMVAIVGSAYIGSGLLAARMAFFRERLRRWQAAPVPPGLKARG